MSLRRSLILRPAGSKRAITGTQNPDPELLGALAELAFGDVANGPVTPREIRFLTLSDRARAEG
jgi:hypothetical protein